jgi:2-polyprenyl-3-methyl-5-hydroxy-6-metoxy-1,4-benzoquinol methylase
MSDYKSLDRCLCCNSTDIEILLDLNNQPLANSYHDNTKVMDEYPLGVNICNNCYHIQLTHVVNPDLLFKDYLYVSGTTQTLHGNMKWFVDYVLEQTTFGKSNSVLDIACNDGTQLNYFKNEGFNTYGIDPAENLHKLSSKNHDVVCDYFNSDSVGDRVFDIITAQNVFAHNSNPKEFLDECEKIMHDNSVLYIQTSQAEMILNNQFDTIYHEHVSFFNINSMNELVKRTNLTLTDVIKTPVHGISYLFRFTKNTFEGRRKVFNEIEVEKQRGLLSKKTYNEYTKNITELVSDFKESVENSKREGFKLVGYGAAAKGMTFLNFAGVKLDYIIDDNELKHNLYTPGTNTIIKPNGFLKQFKENDKILFIPLAWNFYDEIQERILKTRDNKNDWFLRYFPEVKLERR